MNDDTITTIRRAALHMLARRDYSSAELTKKLSQKGHPLDKIQTVIVNLTESALINEHRYVDNFIYSRRQKGLGPERISRELREKGIPQEIIAEHLEITDNAWFTEVRKTWQKHFKGKLPTNFHERAKQTRFLHYRGYTHDQINCVFRLEDDEYDNQTSHTHEQ